MPPPVVVYIVVGVGAVAAGLALKEFVYKPHVAPKFQQWKQEFSAWNSARRERRQRHAPVPTDQSSTNGRANEPQRGSSDHWEAHGGSSVELDRFDLTPSTQNGSMRHRHGFGDSDSLDNEMMRMLDESNMLIPQLPLTPTPISTRSSTITPVPRSPSMSMSSHHHRLASPPPQQPALNSGSGSNDGLLRPPTAVSPGLPTPPPESPSKQSSTTQSPRVESAAQNQIYLSPLPTRATSTSVSALESTSQSTRSFNTALSQHPDLGSSPRSPFSDALSLALSRSDMVSPFSLADESDVEAASGSEAMASSSHSLSVHEDDQTFSFHSLSTSEAGGSQAGDVHHSHTDEEHFEVGSDGSDDSWEELSGTRSPSTHM